MHERIQRYSSDLSVATLARPRVHARSEQAMHMVKDFLQIPPQIAHTYHELVSRCHKDVSANDASLWEVCNAIDMNKKDFQPRSWSFVTALTLPADDDFTELTSRCVYAMLNLELDRDDPDDFLNNIMVHANHKAYVRCNNRKDRQALWFKARTGLRGLLGIVTRNMAQVIAYLHAAKWLNPGEGPGLGIKLAVATTSGNAEHLVEHLRLNSNDTSTRRVLKDLQAVLTTDLSLSTEEEEAYQLALEAMCVLAIYRRSGDPQRTLRDTFSISMRMVTEKFKVS